MSFDPRHQRKQNRACAAGIIPHMVAVLHSAPEVAAPEALAAWTERVSESFTPD